MPDQDQPRGQHTKPVARIVAVAGSHGKLADAQHQHGNDGSQGDVARRRGQQHPGAEGRQGRQRHQHGHDARPGGHALAAAKAQIDRQQMAEKRQQPGADLHQAMLEPVLGQDVPASIG